MNNRDLKIDAAMLFFFGAAFGILIFIITYGTAILDITYDAWILMSPDIDIKQHYIGFLHYLNAPWSFPLGCMDSLSYPYVMSVVWTDSIPGFCVLLKLFKGLLPAAPQLFGWFGLVTFALNGGFGAILMFRVTRNRALSLFSSIFFVLSFPVLQRLYYHTSLAAHFVILAALYWFVSDKKRSLTERIVGYSLFAFLCVSIHSYFLPFAGVILAADSVKDCIRSDRERQLKTRLISFCLPLFAFCISGMFSLYFYGAFSMPVNHAGFTIGEFNSNLNTFFNSLGDGILLNFTNKYYTQYEGFGYLGLGVLALAALSLIFLIKRLFVLLKKKQLKSFIKTHDKMVLTACMFMIFFIMAVIPEADLNEATIIPNILPDNIRRIFGVFRSNGRFIWGDVYILILSAVYIINKKAGKKAVCLIMGICLILQTADTAPYLAKKREFYTAEHGYFDFLKQNGPDKSSYDHIIMTFDNGDIKMNLAYYAALDKKTMNRFYFARDIDGVVNKKLEEYKENALLGHPEERTVYIFDAEAMKEWEAAPLYVKKITDDVFIGYK